MLTVEQKAALGGATITYSQDAYTKCAYWVRNAKNPAGIPQEIGWEGMVKVRKNHNGPGMHDYLIEDVYLWPDQHGSHASVMGTPEGQAALATWYVKNGIERGNVLHWGHSHGRGDVFQSGTDLANVETTYGFGPRDARRLEPAAPFCVAVTWNTSLEMYGEITIFEPFHIRITKVPVDFIQVETPALLVAKEELKERFTVLVPAQVEHTTNGEWWRMFVDKASHRFGDKAKDTTKAIAPVAKDSAVPEHIRASVEKILGHDEWFLYDYLNQEVVAGFWTKKKAEQDPRASKRGIGVVNRTTLSKMLTTQAQVDSYLTKAEGQKEAIAEADLPLLDWLVQDNNHVGRRVLALSDDEVRDVIAENFTGWYFFDGVGNKYTVSDKGNVQREILNDQGDVKSRVLVNDARMQREGLVQMLIAFYNYETTGSYTGVVVED